MVPCMAAISFPSDAETTSARHTMMLRPGRMTSARARTSLLAGDSMFTANAASGAIRPATGATLQQGALEGSNVDMAQAMSQLVTAQRTYAMDSSAIQDQNQMLQIANEIKP